MWQPSGLVFQVKIFRSSFWRPSTLPSEYVLVFYWGTYDLLCEDLLFEDFMVFYVKSFWLSMWRPSDLPSIDLRVVYVKNFRYSMWWAAGLLCDEDLLVFWVSPMSKNQDFVKESKVRDQSWRGIFFEYLQRLINRWILRKIFF